MLVDDILEESRLYGDVVAILLEASEDGLADSVTSDVAGATKFADSTTFVALPPPVSFESAALSFSLISFGEINGGELADIVVDGVGAHWGVGPQCATVRVDGLSTFSSGVLLSEFLSDLTGTDALSSLSVLAGTASVFLVTSFDI